MKPKYIITIIAAVILACCITESGVLGHQIQRGRPDILSPRKIYFTSGYDVQEFTQNVTEVGNGDTTVTTVLQARRLTFHKHSDATSVRITYRENTHSGGSAYFSIEVKLDGAPLAKRLIFRHPYGQAHGNEPITLMGYGAGVARGEHTLTIEVVSDNNVFIGDGSTFLLEAEEVSAVISD